MADPDIEAGLAAARQEVINSALGDLAAMRNGAPVTQAGVDDIYDRLALARSNLLQSDPAAPVAAMPPRPVVSTGPTYDEYMAPRGNLRDLMNYGFSNAYPRSGPYYTPAGARAGYEDYGLPMPIYQDDPYATAIGRVFTDPSGQLGWQPLMGAVSRYPHVVNGVPRNFMDRLYPILGLARGMWPAPNIDMSLFQRPAARGAAPVAPRGGGGAPAGAPAANKVAATPPPAPLPAYQDPLEPGSARLQARLPYPPYTPGQITPQIQAQIDAEVARRRGGVPPVVETQYTYGPYGNRVEVPQGPNMIERAGQLWEQLRKPQEISVTQRTPYGGLYTSPLPEAPAPRPTVPFVPQLLTPEEAMAYE